MPVTHLALLRGVNVGGRNKLPMQDLAALFSSAGAGSVRTYIQSGNVVFRADEAAVPALVQSVTEQIAGRFNIRTTLVLRTAAELAAAIRDNPYLAQGLPPDKLHLSFLDAQPTAELAAALAPLPGSADAFILSGRHLYLHLPNGAGQAKLPDFDRKLRTVGTMRNWRTVLALEELAAAL